MSLVGRLQDLSFGDVLQIIFLSRRSGELSLRTPSGSRTLFFRNGLVVGGSSPDRSFAESSNQFSGVQSDRDRVRARIDWLVAPLLEASTGEFSFVLGGGPSNADLGYDPAQLFGSEGLDPQSLMGVPQLRPLKNLEQKIQSSAAFLKGTRRGASPETPAIGTSPGTKTQADELDASSSGKYRFRVRKPSASVAGQAQRVVVLFAPDAALRVAVRRTLSTSAPDLRQFYSAAEVAESIHALVRDRTYFVSVLDCTTETAAAESRTIFQLLRRIHQRLPVVILGKQGEKTSAGAQRLQGDLELLVPTGPSDLSSDGFIRAMAHLDRFVEEHFWEWERNVAEFPGESSASADFYDSELLDSANRKYDLLEALIMELSGPDDLLTIASILIRASSEYVDRGAIFSVGTDVFSRVLAFGSEHGTAAVGGRQFTIDRSEQSVLRDVVESGRCHRGKLRKTPANVNLVGSFGPAMPTDTIAVPIVSGNEVVGVFYGDNAKFRQQISETSGLEVFISRAGRAFERARSSETDWSGR